MVCLALHTLPCSDPQERREGERGEGGGGSDTESNSKTSQSDTVRLPSVPPCLGHTLLTIDGLTETWRGALAVDGFSG